MNTLHEKLQEAEVEDLLDTGKINDVLAVAGLEVSLDYAGEMKPEIWAGYYSTKLRKIIQLGEVKVKDQTDLSSIAEVIEDFEREAKDLEESITIKS